MRRQVLVFLFVPLAAVMLFGSLASAGAAGTSTASRAVSAAGGANCPQWNVAGTWTTIQSNVYHTTWHFTQQGTAITGTAVLPAADAARGSLTGTVGHVTGSIKASHLDATVTWPPHTDGKISHGRYVGTVTKGSGSGGGQVTDGEAWDLLNPAAKATWTGVGDANCGASSSQPVTTTKAAQERLHVFFNPTGAGGGISGNIQLQTVGARGTNGAYQVEETYVGGSPEPLSVTRGIFGQHALKLEIVSGSYEPPSTGVASTLTLHVRVIYSTDSACPVGSHGTVTAYVNHRGTGGTEIDLCGETVDIRTETPHLSVSPQ